MANGKTEAMVLRLITMLKTGIEDYCDLETVDGNTIVANDGSLASIVIFHGTKSVLGREQFDDMIERMSGSLAVAFSSKGHQLQVVFRRDLDATAALEAVAIQQRMTADRVHLSVHDLINEGRDKYAGYVYDEACYLVLWSRPALLDPAEVKMSRDEINEFRKDHDWPSMKDAQNLLRPIRYLYDRHAAFVGKMCDDLGSAEFGCSVERIDVRGMLRAARKSVFADYTSDNWEPSLPGDRIPMRWKSNDDQRDASELLYPPLARQLMIGVAEYGSTKSKTLPDPTTVRIGGRVYAPLLYEVPPTERQNFNNLFNALNRAETRQNGVVRAVPYSISFMLESDGMSVLTWKTIFTNLLGITSEINRNINSSSKALGERSRDGECITKLRIAAMTWADQDDTKELALRKAKLWRALEGWGRGTVIERSGNPMLAFQSNAVGLSPKHIGNPAPAPLVEALSLMPFTRPASPFPKGSITYRSLDGKILWYERFSSEQSTWITLISGKPGSGKSVLMNNNNIESCLMPGATRLPFLCVIDIGVSSEGMISVVRDNLPDHLKHLAIYKRLQNRAEYCINALDTPAGSRLPLPKDRSFLVTFLSTLATPAERKGVPFDGMSSFIGRVVDGAYKSKSDQFEKSQPQRYSPGHNQVVDEGVDKLGLPVLEATTYWQLVDAFFEAGMFYEMEVAQRYAVPTLDTLIAYAASDEIVKEYADARASNGMSINDAFRLGLREAISDFPIFSAETRFDVGASRIMSLDLQDVAITGSPAAHKQTALMYMIARQAFMKKVAYSKEDLPFFNPTYKDYFERLIADIAEDYKVLCMDEFHKTGGHELLRQQVETDGREARKWMMEIILASQLHSDFGNLVKIATTHFILDSGTPETRKWLRENVSLTPVQESALVNFVHGAGRNGTTFLAIFDTKSAKFAQLFTSTVGPMRLWALTTTAEDRKLRSMLYAAMPSNEARSLLAKRFPGGTCKAAVDRLKAEMFTGAEFVDDDMESSVIERVAKDLIAEYFGTAKLVAA